MSGNPMKNFELDRESIQYIGQDLQRPECILAEPDGTLWSADARGGVVHIWPDGRQETSIAHQFICPDLDAALLKIPLSGPTKK